MSKKKNPYSCEGGINRIHHWCSVGIEKSQPEGSPFQWETRLAFIYHDRTVQYCVYLLVTSLRSMFTVNDTRLTNQLETPNKQCIKQWTNAYFIKMD